MPELFVAGASFAIVGLICYLAGVPRRRPARRPGTPTSWADIVQPRYRPARRLDDWDTGVIRRVVIPAHALVTNHRRR